MRASFLIALILFSALSVDAKSSRRSTTPLLETTFKIDSYFGYTYQEPLESVFNPGNRLFLLSTDIGFVELRPEIRFDIMGFSSIVARPRLRAVTQVPPDTVPETENDGYVDIWMNEGFVSLRPYSELEFTIGRQNYQWGPAELLNPSNIFFPQLLTRLEPFYEVRGVTMARANLSIGSDFSWVTLAELNPLDDQDFESETSREDSSLNRIQTKLEYSWENGSNYVGVTAGSYENANEPYNVGGAYAAYTFSDAFQTYVDFVFQPDPDTDEEGSAAIAFYGTGGLRYTTEGGTEFRIEGVRNGLGRSADEYDELKAALTDPFLQLIALTSIGNARAGLPGQNYVYLSTRWTGDDSLFGFLQAPMIAARSLIATTDQSSFSTLTFEAGLSDLFSLYLYGGIAAGARDSELRQVLNHATGLAVRASF